MKLKILYTSIIVLMQSAVCLAQTPTKVYRSKDGRLYSAAQKDSIASLGYGIGEVSITTERDTSFIAIEIYPKQSASGSALVQRYKDKKLPSFRLKTLDGKMLDSKSLQGKVVMINFWSTTCGPCIKEMPELNVLKRKYKDVVFLAPAPEDAAKINTLISKYPFEFIILPDAQKLFEEWRIEDYPKNFFVDRKGIIREVKEGTPLYRAKASDEWRVSVVRTYSPLIDDLVQRK